MQNYEYYPKGGITVRPNQTTTSGWLYEHIGSNDRGVVGFIMQGDTSGREVGMELHGICRIDTSHQFAFGDPIYWIRESGASHQASTTFGTINGFLTDDSTLGSWIGTSMREWQRSYCEPGCADSTVMGWTTMMLNQTEKGVYGG